MPETRVLITGATGFIGTALVRYCRADPRLRVRAAARTPPCDGTRDIECFAIGDIAAGPDWQEALSGVDVVVHTAARVHMMNESASDPLLEFRRVNVTGTTALARQAVRAGVRRFVFVSSIKVNGDSTSYDDPFTAADSPRPLDPYGVSKWEAEEALREISRDTGLEVVIVRPPLVYGPRVGGNFLRLMRLVQAGAILPLKSVRNARSLIYVDNLVSALLACARDPRAAGETFLVCDDEDLSTPDLIRRLAHGFGGRPRLVPLPQAILRLGGAVTGRAMEVDRLTGSLRVDSSHIQRTLGWRPPFSVDDALAETVRWFKSAPAATE